MADNATLYIDLKTRFDNVETKIDKLMSLSERASQSISSSFKKVTFTSPPVKAYEQYVDTKNKLDSKSYKDFAEYEKLKTQVEKLEGHKRLQEYIAYKDKEKQYYESIGKSLIGIGTKLSIGVTAPLMLIGAQALKTAGSFEQYKVSFDTMLKSTDKSQKLLKDIEKFAAATPFQLPGLVVGAKRLLAFGVESDKIVEKLKNLGNAAGGNEEILDRLTLAYGKLQAKGKATMEELNMFIEAGVPLLDELAKGFNISTAELSEMISTGKVGFEDVDKAITNLTTGTGQFAGLIEKQSTTLNGVVSTMKDNMNLLGKDIITVILPDLKKLALFVSDVASGFRNMDEGTKKAIVTIAGLAMASGPLLVVGGKLVQMYAVIPEKIGGVIKGLNALKVAAMANPLLAVATAVTVASVAFGAWYLKSHDLNTINRNLQESTDKLKTSMSGYKEVVAKLTGDTSKLSDEEERLLKLQKLKYSDEIINQISKINQELKKASEGGFDIRMGMSLNIEERKKLAEEIEAERKKIEDEVLKRSNDTNAIFTYLDRWGVEWTVTVEEAQDYLDKLNQDIKHLRDPIIEHEEQLKTLAKQMSEIEGNTELYHRALAHIDSDYIEILKKQDKLVESSEEQAKKEEELKKLTEDRKKATEDLLEKRKKLREELDQELNNQGKTELQQIEAKRQAELKAASELYKNTKQVEEYNKAKADINKIYDNQIAEYKKKVDRETLQTKITLLNQELEAVKSKAKDQINTTGSLNEKDVENIREAEETKKTLLAQRFEYQKELLKQEHEEKITNYQKDLEQYKNNAEMKASIQNQMLAENESYNAELQRLAEETGDKIEDNNKSLVSMSASTVSALGNIEDSFSGFQSTLDETQISYAGMAESIGSMTQALSSIVSSAMSQIGEATNGVTAAFAGIAAGLQTSGAVVSLVAESMANETQRSLSLIENEYEETVSSIERTLQKQTKAIDEETQKQLEILKEYYAERGIEIETGYETELEKAQEQYEALLEAKEEYDESENERRLEELEAYAESLQGMTDVEIEEAIRQKELELTRQSEKEKLAQEEKIGLAKAEVDKQKILEDAAKKKKAAEKKAAMEKWEAECKMIESENKAKKEAFEQQKAMATIQATIGMLMGIAMIWANAFASYPPIPAAVIAGIFTGIMAALGAVQIGLIQAQPPPPEQPIPPPPVFRVGGIAPGDRSEGVDSQNVMVSPKEMMLNDEQQAYLFNAIANNQLGGNITVEVYAQIWLDSEQIPISKIILNQRHFARNRE